MSESSSFTSLLDLVNSHLSNCNLENTKEIEETVNKQKSTAKIDISKTLSKSPFGNNKGSPIYDVLNKQISNMLESSRKEKEQKEKEGLKNNSDSEQAESYVIDLVGALQITPKALLTNSNTTESQCSSDLPMLKINSLELKASKQRRKTRPSKKKCGIIDVSYIMKSKRKRAKSSAIAKVIGARLKPVIPPPWTKDLKAVEWHTHPEVNKFDFSIESPCDCLEKFKRGPTIYTLPTNIKYDDLNLDPDRIYKQTADDFVMAMQDYYNPI